MVRVYIYVKVELELEAGLGLAVVGCGTVGRESNDNHELQTDIPFFFLSIALRILILLHDKWVMVLRWLYKQHAVRVSRLTRSDSAVSRAAFATCARRYAQNTAQDEAKSALSRTRNIGIIAHIDAVRRERVCAVMTKHSRIEVGQNDHH